MILAKMEWKVPHQIYWDLSPTKAVILSFISLAALLVKVIARIDPGATLCFFIMYAILYVITLVLPEPAPASMSKGPSRCITASFCSGLRPSRRLSASLSSRPLAAHDTVAARALELIRREACSGLKAAQVVKAMGVSERLAETRFRQATGRRITEEIAAVRLERVLELLRDPKQDIGPIANLCGWRSDAYLKRLFRQRFGMTMREWQNRNAGERG